MELITNIITKLDSISGLTVLYENPSYANIRLDRLTGPFAILYLVTESNIDLSKNLLFEGVNAEIYFCDRVVFNSSGSVIQSVVDAQYSNVLSFLHTLKEDKTIEYPDTITMRTAYGKFDCETAGLSLELFIKNKQGRCL